MKTLLVSTMLTACAVASGAALSQKTDDNGFNLKPCGHAIAAGNAGDMDMEISRFSLSLKRKPGDAATWVRSKDASKVMVTVGASGDREIIFKYQNASSPVRETHVTVRREVDGAVRSKLSCAISPGWFLERTSFPEIDIDCEDAKRLIVGSSKGGVFHNSATWHVGRESSCRSPGSCCAQFAAAWNDSAGHYFGIEDAKGYVKTFGFKRTADGIRFYHSENVWTAKCYTQDYWIVSRQVNKGAEPLRWYDFADIYKAWDRKQAWSRTPFLARTDIPDWMKDAPAFTRFSRQWLERPEAVKKFMDWWKTEIGDGPVVAALWGWEKLGTWWGPDYFPCHPSDEAFTTMMNYLRGKGFHPFSWPSGYNWSKVIGDKGDGTYEWDGREKFIKPVEQHLVMNEDGSLCHVPAFWLRNGALTTICGGDRWSHDWWNGLTKELARRGCDIVQVDQVVGGRIGTCWNTKHGHPAGNGIWMWQSFRHQMEEMHAAIRSVEPDGLIGVEEPNMMYNDIVGIQDYRDLESTADEIASIYSYLYHGYVPMFQSNPFRDEFFSLAHAATDGQMPFYRPDFAELESSRPALQNGGFENLVDSVRGPMGWDRLIPNRLLHGVDASKPLWNFTGHNNMGWLGYAATLEHDDKHGGEVSLLFDVPEKGGRDWGRPIQVSQTVDGLTPGQYEVSAWVKTLSGNSLGALKYGTRDGEQGEITFPDTGTWTKVSAVVSVGSHLRLVLWAPPGAKFLVDDIRLERDGREVVVSGDSPYTRFLKKWIALYRGEGRDFLANGFRIKPPALKCDMFRLAARQLPAVCFAAYESATGKRAIVLANATAKPQRVTGIWQGRHLDITLLPHDLKLITTSDEPNLRARGETIRAETARSLTLTAELDPDAKGAITHLRGTDGFDFIARPTHLFEFMLTRKDDFTRQLKLTSKDAADVKFARTKNGLDIKFIGFKDGISEATVTVRGDDRLRWRFDVKTKDGWVLESGTCPRVILKATWDGTTRDERITSGHSNGGCYKPLDPRRKTHFPTADRPGRMSMQYAGMFNRVRGFYTAAEDPANESKQVSISTLREGRGDDYASTVKGINWFWCWRLWGEQGGTQPYDVVMKGISSDGQRPVDWRDITDIYREWVMPQGWCAEPIPLRKDLPAWMKSGPAKTFFKRCWLADPDEIRRWMDEYYSPTFKDVPLVISFWGWEHQDLWVGPDYFPAFPGEDAFRRLVSDLKTKGGHTFLWPSGFRWLTTFDRKGDGTFDFDDRADWERIAKPHAVLKRDGSEDTVYTALWWRGGSNKQVCGGDEWSIDWFLANVRHMIELGAESVQIDQQGGGKLSGCWARNHGHPPGEGVWKFQAFTHFLERLRDELKKSSSEVVLGMEAPGDAYNRFWGIQDHRDCEGYHTSEWASTFNWLYHEYVPTFQSNMFMRRHDRPFVAHCAVDGQLPYAVPSRADFAKGEPVIWNGSFEKTAPNGEFAGWERLRGEYINGTPFVWCGRAYPDKTDAKDGNGAVRLETLGKDDTVALSQDIFTDDEAFVPGTRYRLSAWLQTECTDAPDRCFMEPQVFTEGEMMATSMPRVPFPRAGDGWRRVTADFTLPAKTILLRPHFRSAGKTVARVDGVVLERILPSSATEPVVFTGRSPYNRFMKKWIALYHGNARKYLAHGRQIRGAEVSCKTFHYVAECHVNLIYNGSPETGATDDEMMPIVASQSYEAADGTKVLALANTSSEAQEVSYVWRGRKHVITVAGDDFIICKLQD